MPKVSSAAKRVRVTEKRTLRNRQVKSAMRTAIRKYLQAIEAGSREEAEQSLRKAISQIDRAASKGVIHKNQAARRKSRLSKRLASLAG
ncbi:MAG: 30S ribosomal protein S20 [Limnochordia bacterium]|nr:30S ribosomal protein S20 [Bacillota bacterium]